MGDLKLLNDEILFIEGASGICNFSNIEHKVIGGFSLKKLEEELPEEIYVDSKNLHRSIR